MNKGLQDIFSKIPSIYESMNHVLTFGMDVIWRRRAVKIAASAGGAMWLDMCSGTGETAAYLKRAAGEGTHIIAADFSLPMLNVARAKRGLKNVEFVTCDANTLPFPDGTFDLITITFATRNICVTEASRDASLSEFFRVLKKGGRFVSLETSQPPNRFIRGIFHYYTDKCIKLVGRLSSSGNAGYRYLSDSMQRFYSAEQFADIIRQNGFASVRCHKMMFGAIAIHEAAK